MSIPAKQPTPEQKKLFQDWMAIHALDDTGRQVVDWSSAPYGICIMLRNGTGVPVYADGTKAKLI